MNTTAAHRTNRVLPSAAQLSIGSGIAFLMLLVAVHIARSDLDPSWHPISEYALGTFGGLMTLAFLTWGFSAWALAFALRTNARTLLQRIGLVFLLIGGAGPIIAALFPTDPITTSRDAMTMHGTIHAIGASLIDGTLIAATLLTIGLFRSNPQWRAARWPISIATLVAWVAFALLTTQMLLLLPDHGGQLGPEVPIGWSSRFLVVVYAVWVIVVAWQTLKRQHHD